MSTIYRYTFTIDKGGNAPPLTLSISGDNDTRARLKAKTIAKQFNGTVKNFKKEKAPYKSKDEKVNKVQELLMAT
jgi:hypothetical protein